MYSPKDDTVTLTGRELSSDGRYKYNSTEIKGMVLNISKDGDTFTVDNKMWMGSPYVGRGKTMIEAIGRFFHCNQNTFGFSFIVEDTAWPDEQRRRREELKER